MVPTKNSNPLIGGIYYWPAAYTQCRRARLVTVAGVCRRL